MYDHMTERRRSPAFDPYPDHPRLPMAEYKKRGRALTWLGALAVAAAATGFISGVYFVVAVVIGFLMRHS